MGSVLLSKKGRSVYPAGVCYTLSLALGWSLPRVCILLCSRSSSLVEFDSDREPSPSLQLFHVFRSPPPHIGCSGLRVREPGPAGRVFDLGLRWRVGEIRILPWCTVGIAPQLGRTSCCWRFVGRSARRGSPGLWFRLGTTVTVPRSRPPWQ